jgi:hypothetical protein
LPVCLWTWYVFSRVTPSFITSLRATYLSAAHRGGHKQDHKHDGNRDHDHNDAGGNRKYK